MPGRADYDLYCPECKKKASTANPMFIRYSVRRLELPIFLCGECRTIYVEKPTVRRIISEWRKGGMWTKMSLRQLCDEFLGELEESVWTYWVAHLGYRKARFVKHPKSPTP